MRIEYFYENRVSYRFIESTSELTPFETAGMYTVKHPKINPIRGLVATLHPGAIEKLICHWNNRAEADCSGFSYKHGWEG